MAKGRTISLIFKNNAGLSLAPVSFVVNDGEQGLKGDKGATGAQGIKGDKGDNADINIEAIIPKVAGGETSFIIGAVKVFAVQINGISQPQGYSYTVEGTTLFLAEPVKSTDFISIEVTK
ncbi:hypothetical protein AB7250_01780 [Providencia stuartii]|uniref:hypothetical protein n=1 Tax=Providencia stuartii TaxID=588 RepID=UPI0033213E41